MSVSPNVLAVLSEVAGSKRTDVYTAFDEVKEYVLAACDQLNEATGKAEELRSRLEKILAENVVDKVLDGVEVFGVGDWSWLCDKPEIEKHLATLSDALDEMDGAA